MLNDLLSVEEFHFKQFTINPEEKIRKKPHFVFSEMNLWLPSTCAHSVHFLFISQCWPDVSTKTKIPFCFTRYWRRNFHLPAELNLQSKKRSLGQEIAEKPDPIRGKKLGINLNFLVQPEFNHKCSWCCLVICASLLSKPLLFFLKYPVQNRSHTQAHSQNSSGLLLE